MTKSKISLSGFFSISIAFSSACSTSRSSQSEEAGPAKTAQGSDDQEEKPAGGKPKKSKTPQSADSDAPDDGTSGDGARSPASGSGGVSANLLDLMTGSWVGGCEEEQTDATPPETYYKIETLTFGLDGSYQEEEAEFTDENCSRARDGGDKKVVDKGTNVQVSKSVSSDTVFITFKRVRKMNDETKKLEDLAEDMSALVKVTDSQLTIDKKASADNGFTPKAETYEKL